MFTHIPFPVNVSAMSQIVYIYIYIYIYIYTHTIIKCHIELKLYFSGTLITVNTVPYMTGLAISGNFNYNTARASTLLWNTDFIKSCAC